MFGHSSRWCRSRLGLMMVALAPTVAGTAFAQTDEDRSGARAAAEAGAAAFSEQRWSDAVDMFTRAESLVHSPVHLLFLARSHAKLGQLVKARELYIRVASEPVASDAPDVVVNAVADSKKELDALQPRLAQVTVAVEGAGGKPVTVTMDGVQMSSALVGVPRPADPGEHRFQAFAEGLASPVSAVTLAEGGKSSVVLTLAPGAGLPPGGPAPAGGPAAPAAPADTGAAQDEGGGGGSGLLVAGLVSLGVGVGGIVVGSVFGVQAMGKRDDADALCETETRCDFSVQNQVQALDDDADSANTLSIVGFAVGGVGIAAGVTFLILSAGSGSETAATEPMVRPWVGVGSAGVLGRF